MCVKTCLHVHECVDLCVHTRIMLQGASASGGIIQMLPPCLLIPPLGQLSPHRRDQTRTMPVWQPPFSVLEPCGKWRPSAAELMKALLNSHSTKPCMSAVQSQAPSSCVSVSKPLRIFWEESYGNVISSKPFNALLGRWAELVLRGLWVNLLYFFSPMMLRCFTLDPLYCFLGLVHKANPFYCQQFPTSSSVCICPVMLRYCYHYRVDISCETTL